MILDGKTASKALFEKLKTRYEPFLQNVLKPKIAVIQVGNNEASSTYIRLKQKKFLSLGFGFEHILFNSDVNQEVVLGSIRQLNNNPEINAILLQLPLPAHIDQRVLLEAITPKKDVDCLTAHNMGNFTIGVSSFMPATPLGVIRLLEFYSIRLESKNICVIGRSNLVGKPLALALSNRNATVTLCHSRTKDIATFTQMSDIIISAVGKPLAFGREFFKEGQIIIDVGTSHVEGLGLRGDVQFNEVLEVVEGITPVPGGVGPMTIYGLVENFVTLLES